MLPLLMPLEISDGLLIVPYSEFYNRVCFTVISLVAHIISRLLSSRQRVENTYDYVQCKKYRIPDIVFKTPPEGLISGESQIRPETKTTNSTANA
jgi:hypothetical protein